MEAESEKPKSKRVFINQVDQYQCGNIAKYLSHCVVGASLEETGEEDEVASGRSSVLDTPKEGCYEIVATLKNQEKIKPDFVKELIKYGDKDQLYEQLAECSIIVYDITEDPDQIDEAVWAISELHADLDKIDKPKMFILISSCMTWAKSKPLDPDDPEIPFTEDDYRRRRPHPNFKEHISAEKTVIKLGKTNKAKLVTYVVCAGLTYGAEENIFHYLFKSAWHNVPELQCFGNGENVVPTIHIHDLAAVIQNIADSRPKVRYLIAKDDSQNTVYEIVKAVSKHLGSGKIKYITKEQALLSRDIEQADFDQLLVNLRMDAVFVKENMRINWVAETGLVENIQAVVKEYKDSRNLLPLRAVILGPPASGKTTIIQQLCQFYKLHHIKIKDVIDEAIEHLQMMARAVVAEEEGEGEGEGEEDEKNEMGAEEAQSLLEQINQSKEENGGRIDDPTVIRFFQQRLKSKPCQNQGFILDGYPKTQEQAKDLFALEDEEEAEEGKPDFNKSTMPDFVFCLMAGDDFLKQRVMNLPEAVVAGTHNTEKELIRRLSDYRSLNTEDDTVLIYFDEREFHPEKIDVTKDNSPMMMETVEKIKKLMGKPRNYGLTPEEIEEQRRQEEEERVRKEKAEKEEKEKREAEEAAERKCRQEEWAQRLNEVKREEYELLEAQSIPLRNYLMQHIMPTLTEALIDCCKTRPDDPIDYIAEYLFQHNAQVD